MILNSALAQIVAPLKPLLFDLAACGAKCYLVGGAVRDLFLFEHLQHDGVCWPPEDIDIEVFGISLEALQKKLDAFSHTILVGKQFGVLHMPKYRIDWSVPRKDSVGRKPVVAFCAEMTIEQALIRRDITINAMAVDLTQKTVFLVDPFNGLQDLRSGTICYVSPEKFVEDPLRFFRVMQFLARFEFVAAPELNILSKTMRLERKDKQDAAFVAKERITVEILKMLAKSQRPSIGFAWVKDLGRLEELFPVLFAILQRGAWDQFCRALDACRASFLDLAATALGVNLSDGTTLILQLASILFWIEEKELRKQFLDSLSFNRDDATQALILATAAVNVIDPQDDYRLKMQAKRLGRCKLLQLFLLQKSLSLLSYKNFVNSCEKALALGVLCKPLSFLVTGRDLLGKIAEGPEMKVALDAAYQLQLQHPEYGKFTIIEKVLSGRA